MGIALHATTEVVATRPTLGRRIAFGRSFDVEHRPAPGVFDASRLGNTHEFLCDIADVLSSFVNLLQLAGYLDAEVVRIPHQQLDITQQGHQRVIDFMIQRRTGFEDRLCFDL